MNPLITSLLLFAGLTVFVYTMYGRPRSSWRMKPENRLDHLAERRRRCSASASARSAWWIRRSSARA